MKKTRVLLVEDDPLLRAAIELTLQNLGYAVVGSVANRSETLHLLKTSVPDLVVISSTVLGKIGMGIVREMLAEQHMSVFVIPGDTREMSGRSTSSLRTPNLSSLLAISRVVQVLFGPRRFVLN